MSAVLIIYEMPNTCKECPLFVNVFGHPAYCQIGAAYTSEEISSVKDKDGFLEMYYHGCLSNRPNACPLKEELK